MAVLDGGEPDLQQLWSIITELSEQLSQNRNQSVALFARAGELKNQALDVQTGFVLRRYNTNLNDEQYEAELERMNTTMTTENQNLLQDNKQLSILIKEYETALEMLMSTFRNRAQDVQERELSLIREYESKLLALEEANSKKELISATTISASVARISHLLRQYLRALGGEEIPALEPEENGKDERHLDERVSWTGTSAAEHALGREIELARLEKENEELRRVMGLIPPIVRPPNPESRVINSRSLNPFKFGSSFGGGGGGVSNSQFGGQGFPPAYDDYNS